jgi:hypothetical protein
MMSTSAAFLVPAATVPMPPQIWSILRNNDEVPDAGLNDGLASRAHIRFTRLVRLDRMDKLVVEVFEDRQRIEGRGFAACW